MTTMPESAVAATLVFVAWTIASTTSLVAVCMVIRNLTLAHKISKLETLAAARKTRAHNAETAAQAWEDRALTAEALVEGQIRQLTGDEP